jgi:hypothetical protein
VVPRELRGIEPTTEDWHAVFGKDNDVIADAYTDYYELVEEIEWEHERRLFLLLIERQHLECESSSWEVGHWFTSSHGTDYFSPERDRILAAVKEGVVWLTTGLEKLFAILRARQSKPTSIPVASPDDPIYQEGWTVFIPQGFRKPATQPKTRKAPKLRGRRRATQDEERGD